MALERTIAALDVAKKVAPSKVEYWMARDIQVVLGYKRWENFADAIQRARCACEKSGENPNDHFRQTAKMIEIGKTAQRRVLDYFLDRYACYLVAMNGDPSISQIAAAQRYFAVQTRKQEIQEEGSLHDKRLEQRKRRTTAVVKLNMAAKAAGVQNFALFHDAGYRGLYEMGLGEIKKKKGLSHKEDLYDRAGRAELAAAAGEEIVIVKAGKPYARLVPMAQPKRAPGAARGKGRVTRKFFEPLPKGELAGWE